MQEAAAAAQWWGDWEPTWIYGEYIPSTPEWIPTREEAEAMMDSIWRPGGVWAKFIGKDADIDQPNRYLGYEY